MLVECPECGKMYNDEPRWTICPHRRLDQRPRGRVAIRVDDIGWGIEELEYPIKKPDKNLELAKRFHEAMDGLPYLAGVIPAALDHKGLEWIQSRPGGMTVALHGWNHGSDRVYERDEFSGRGVEDIRERIARGRTLLRTDTRHLIPPYNSLPGNLCEAAWHEGIRYIWAGPAIDCQTYKDLKLIPSDAGLYGATQWFQSPGSPIVNISLSNRFNLDPSWELAVVVLHLPWEAARDPEFCGIRELVEIVGKDYVTPDEYVKEAFE